MRCSKLKKVDERNGVNSLINSSLRGAGTSDSSRISWKAAILSGGGDSWIEKGDVEGNKDKAKWRLDVNNSLHKLNRQTCGRLY